MTRFNLLKPRTFIKVQSSRVRTWIGTKQGQWVHVVVTGFGPSEGRNAEAVVSKNRW